jgi:tRNA uridine 5-carboxymethylaminomethyl modification enzyme
LKEAYYFIEATYLKPTPELIAHLSSLGHGKLQGGISGLELLRRQDMTYEHLQRFMPLLDKYQFSELEIMQFEIMVKFEGYIAKQKDQARAYAKYDEHLLPENMDYLSLDGLATEARQKLHAIQPRTLGQASRISGVNPADIAHLVMLLKKKKYEFSRS